MFESLLVSVPDCGCRSRDLESGAVSLQEADNDRALSQLEERARLIKQVSLSLPFLADVMMSRLGKPLSHTLLDCEGFDFSGNMDPSNCQKTHQ